jgi:hypothetical protein
MNVLSRIFIPTTSHTSQMDEPAYAALMKIARNSSRIYTRQIADSLSEPQGVCWGHETKAMRRPLEEVDHGDERDTRRSWRR